ncbi:hypothetical protein [Streptomyces sp. NPDC060243]|uniref:hypothetical protein n=1 Tax=Streptomyces sp. NPDC060243 TaxID=3347081 RepID=UPI0036593B69
MEMYPLKTALGARSTEDVEQIRAIVVIATPDRQVIANLGFSEDEIADLSEDLGYNRDYRADTERLLGSLREAAPVPAVHERAVELAVFTPQFMPQGSVWLSAKDTVRLTERLNESLLQRNMQRLIESDEAYARTLGMQQRIDEDTTPGQVAPHRWGQLTAHGPALFAADHPHLAADIAEAGEWPDETDLGQAVDHALTISSEQLPTLTGDVLRDTPAPQQRAVLAALDSWFGQIPDSLAHEDDDWDGTL